MAVIASVYTDARADRGVCVRFARVLSSAAVAALLLVGATQSASFAATPSAPAVVRIAGGDRYETAVAISRAAYPAGAPVAFLASGADFPDATGAAASAAALHGPVLLTPPDVLTSAVATELSRLHPATIYILGGAATTGDSVERIVRTLGAAVIRLDGVDRYDTAARASRVAYPTTAPVVFLASGVSFPDALSGAPAAARLGGPILLTSNEALPASVASALRSLAPHRLIVLGSSATISDRTMREAESVSGLVAERWGGVDRYATSLIVSQRAFGEGAAAVYLASGQKFPDALSGGAVAGAIGAPLILSDPDRPSPALRLELRRLAPAQVTLVGGSSTLSSGLMTSIAAASAPVDGDGDGVFGLATYPDTQQEVFPFRGTDFVDRSRWVVNNRRALDLRFVLHTGDVVNWDTPDHAQYQIARAAFRPLDDAGIPYALSIGNHDTQATGVGGSARDPGNTYALQRDTSVFNSYWKPTDYTALAGAFESGKVDNTYSLFHAEGATWLVMNLELWPRLSVITWAQGVISTHPTANVIIQTHSFLDGSALIDGAGRSAPRWEYGDASPQYIYDHLVAPYGNVKVVTSGHTGGAASRTVTTAEGNTVAFLLQTMHSNTDNPVRLSEINVDDGTIDTWVQAPSDGAIIDESLLAGLSFIKD